MTTKSETRVLTVSEFNQLVREGAEFVPGDKVAFTVVATFGHACDWTAYWGNADQDIEAIASEGDKLDPEAARKLLPLMAYTRYTYRR